MRSKEPTIEAIYKSIDQRVSDLQLLVKADGKQAEYEEEWELLFNDIQALTKFPGVETYTKIVDTLDVLTLLFHVYPYADVRDASAQALFYRGQYYEKEGRYLDAVRDYKNSYNLIPEKLTMEFHDRAAARVTFTKNKPTHLVKIPAKRAIGNPHQPEPPREDKSVEITGSGGAFSKPKCKHGGRSSRARAFREGVFLGYGGYHPQFPPTKQSETPTSGSASDSTEKAKDVNKKPWQECGLTFDPFKNK